MHSMQQGMFFVVARGGGVRGVYVPRAVSRARARQKPERLASEAFRGLGDRGGTGRY